MSSHRMPHADGARDPGLIEKGQQIFANSGPVIGRSRLTAPAVSARVERYTALIRELPNNRIPTPRMETGGMREEQGWLGARPIPYRQAQIARADFGRIRLAFVSGRHPWNSRIAPARPEGPGTAGATASEFPSH